MPFLSTSIPSLADTSKIEFNVRTDLWHASPDWVSDYSLKLLLRIIRFFYDYLTIFLMLRE